MSTTTEIATAPAIATINSEEANQKYFMGLAVEYETKGYQWTAGQSAILAAGLADKLGVPELAAGKDIAKVMKGVMIYVIRKVKPITFTQAVEAFNASVYELQESMKGDVNEEVKEVVPAETSATTATTTTEAATTAAEPVGGKPKRKRRTKAEMMAIRGDMKMEPILPSLLAEPSNTADPMFIMADSICKYHQPRWENAAKKAAADALNSALPTLVTDINNRIKDVAASSGGDGVDADEINALMDKKLHNGAGEQIRALVEPQIRGAMIEILDHTKSVITKPTKATEEKLMAAFYPSPDPNYAWTPEMESMFDMLDKQSAVEPQNAVFVGPSGAGKTQAAIEFAAKYGRPCFIMNCGAIRESRDWLGSKGASGGSTYFRKSQFWMAVEAGRCVVVLDEFNRVHSSCQNSLYQLLDFQRRTWSDEAQAELAVGPSTLFFATLNEGLEFTGTHAWDRAMKTRFLRRVEVNYLPEEMEIKVLMSKVGGLGKSEARKLVELGNAIRAKATGFGGGLSETLSTRQLLGVASDYVAMGPQSLRFTVFSHFSADGGVDSERSQVIKMFEGKGFKLA
jgi:nitric oxide reductase NorQ protein